MSTNLEPETEQSSTPVNPKLNQEPQTFITRFLLFQGVQKLNLLSL